MKNILPIIIALLFIAAPAYAYELNGTLSTGAGVAPATPTGLETLSVSPGDTSITTKWNDVADIGGYYLYRITGASTTPSVLIASTTSSSYTDTGLSDGNYSYQVESYLGTLTSTRSLPTASMTIDATVSSNSPVSPSGGSTTSTGGSGVVTNTSTIFNKADFNHDGKVGIFDFNTLINHWGMTSGATKADGDANNDGKVDIFDFNILINNWPTT